MLHYSYMAWIADRGCRADIVHVNSPSRILAGQHLAVNHVRPQELHVGSIAVGKRSSIYRGEGCHQQEQYADEPRSRSYRGFRVELYIPTPDNWPGC